MKNLSWVITTFSMMFLSLLGFFSLLPSCQEDGSERQGTDVVINESGDKGRAVCRPLTLVSWGHPVGRIVVIRYSIRSFTML